jgi:hypothetical protein
MVARHSEPQRYRRRAAVAACRKIKNPRGERGIEELVIEAQEVVAVLSE